MSSPTSRLSKLLLPSFFETRSVEHSLSLETLAWTLPQWTDWLFHNASGQSDAPTGLTG